MRRIRFLVFGNVQGVAYRYYSSTKAKSLNLRGFVENNPDGSVSVVAEGSSERIDDLLDFCKKNPGKSKVDHLEIEEDEEIQGFSFSDFEAK